VSIGVYFVFISCAPTTGRLVQDANPLETSQVAETTPYNSRNQRKIIKPYSGHVTFYPLLFVAELTCLESRRDQLSRSFFQDTCHPSSYLYHLLPLHICLVSAKNSHTVHTSYPTHRKYCSFIRPNYYALNQLKSLPGTTP